jgi:acetyl/propionyl-CoA carboxylase alpha subunit
MTFEVEIDSRLVTVSVEALDAAGPTGGRFRVVVDGQAVEISAVPSHLGPSLIFAVDGRVLDAAVTPQRGGQWLVQLPHVSLTALIDGRSSRRPGARETGGPGVQRVLAPMPGRVVRVLVKPGDDVALRQGLVVVEAMKMENELGSPKAGRVKEVAVEEGASVEAGRLLVVVE